MLELVRDPTDGELEQPLLFLPLRVVELSGAEHGPRLGIAVVGIVGDREHGQSSVAHLGDPDRRLERRPCLGGAVEGDPDVLQALGPSGRIAAWRDRDRARRVVHERLADAAGEGPPDRAAVRGAEHEDLGALGLGELVEGLGGARARDRTGLGLEVAKLIVDDGESVLHLDIQLALQVLDPHQVGGPRQRRDRDRPRRQHLAQQTRERQRVVAVVDRLVADDDLALGRPGGGGVHMLRLSARARMTIGVQPGFASVVSAELALG